MTRHVRWRGVGRVGRLTLYCSAKFPAKPAKVSSAKRLQELPVLQVQTVSILGKDDVGDMLDEVSSLNDRDGRGTNDSVEGSEGSGNLDREE